MTWGNFKNKKVEHPEIILIIGCVLVILGIVASFFNIGLLANLVILIGTFFLGLGFYLKDNLTKNQKLSEYGHFMLGIAALIALPQTPEMFKHILQIEKAVIKLNNIQESQDGKVKIVASAPIGSANTPAEVENTIRNLVRTEKGYPYVSSERKILKSFTDPGAHFPARVLEVPADMKYKPQDFKRSVPQHALDHSSQDLHCTPTPGMAYLTREQADKIIDILKLNGFDKSIAEALVQENLEVCHPMDRSSKCAK